MEVDPELLVLGVKDEDNDFPYFEEEDVCPFAIGPEEEEELEQSPPPSVQKFCSSSCLFCHQNESVPWKGREGNVMCYLRSLCTLLHLPVPRYEKEELLSFKGPRYCVSCQRWIKEIKGVLDKLKDVQKQLIKKRRSKRREQELPIQKEDELLENVIELSSRDAEDPSSVEIKEEPEEIFTTTTTCSMETAITDGINSEEEKSEELDAGDNSEEEDSEYELPEHLWEEDEDDEEEEAKDIDTDPLETLDDSLSPSGESRKAQTQRLKRPERNELKKLTRRRKKNAWYKKKVRSKSVAKGPRCPTCNRYFGTEFLRQVHIRTVHEQDKTPYHCDYAGCNKKYNKSGYYSHIKSHSAVKEFACELCENEYHHLYQLRHHMAVNHTEESNVKCDVCGKTFRNRFNLKLHSRIHANENRFVCQHCGKGFVLKSYLETHVLVKHGDNPFRCPVPGCGKTLSSKASLKLHEEVHNENKERNFVCEVCGKAFPKNIALKLHKNTHISHEEKKHVCSICGARFTRPFSLKEHMKRHQGIRNFSCDVCGKAFFTNCDLKDHKKVTHDRGVKPRNRTGRLDKMLPIASSSSTTNHSSAPLL